jgi:hypothetical protein
MLEVISRTGINHLSKTERTFVAARQSPTADTNEYITDNTDSEIPVLMNTRGDIRIDRIFVDFDISVIPNGSIITGIQLELNVSSLTNEIFYVIPNQNGLLAGDVSDFSGFDYNSPLHYGSFIPNSSKTIITLNDFSFPIPGVDTIFSIGLITRPDYLNYTDISAFSIRTMDSGLYSPRIFVTYNSQPVGVVGSLSGVGKATISSLNGLPSGNISKINDVNFD